jgi:thiamine biosynthesis lipoprotein
MSLPRRRFLQLAVGIGGAVSFGIAERLWRGEARPLQTSTRTSWALGSEVSITALHIDRRQGQAAIEAAFAELELVEQLMSIYRPQSQVSRLNRDGELKSPHPYFVEVLRTAREMSAKSDGAFDITVQPLWAVFDEAKKSGTLPTEAAIAQARAKVDWRRVEISDTRVRLGKEGMAITLNGIAQGFAADKATAALRAHGVEHALIDTGEIGTLGLKENGDAWTVGIQHPRHPDAYISLAKLAGRSLATSGDYATTFSDDFRHHHLFNPRSGYSPHELASVSIAAPSAMLADALSTAVFVLGPERGLKLAASYPQTDLLLMLKNGRTLKTENFPLQV